MGDSSAHFSRKELSCRCCGRLQIDLRLLDGLETLRSLAGVPVRVHADIAALGTTGRSAEFRIAHIWKAWRRT